ncbi:hypothetical protein PHYSODRAFT_523202 [Phytophthora sojae]|uniref:SWIM-type domain-containing protein n=1 Tax=Phytophthora sojae (strain P6497) TaxID=1094619 RepID=G5A439_PHYSP|nr:hypothetical protein PHYSODRAFT_523202 [Phytophthora sojae]EGZ09485.1 hypothetical protein PHYSODRAFT_523202 [Phytophthora sojae]|eukprot:XP_009534346.1 hypothetical protein PHYSODRAFT_523202 [Phytophthora sojae]
MLTPRNGSVSRVGKIPPFRRTVDLDTNRCTCTYMDQHQIPCKHMLTVLNVVGELESAYSGFGSCYMIESYSKAFSAASVMIPASTELTRAPLLPAQRNKTPRGRKRVKRIPSAGESRPTRAQHCTNCGEPSHNRKT